MGRARGLGEQHVMTRSIECAARECLSAFQAIEVGTCGIVLQSRVIEQHVSMPLHLSQHLLRPRSDLSSSSSADATASLIAGRSSLPDRTVSRVRRNNHNRRSARTPSSPCYRITLAYSRIGSGGPLDVTKLLGALVLAIAIISGSYSGFKVAQLRNSEQKLGRRLLRRNSGVKHNDGSRTIFVPYRNKTSKVTIHPTKATTFDAHRHLFLQPPRAAGLGDGLTPQPAQYHDPRWTSKETGLLLSHGLFLLLRTYLSLVVARLDGEIVRDLVAGNGRAFLWGIVKWCGIGTFASYTNAMIKFLQAKVSISFRTRLTRYIHDLYLSNQLTYYKLHNLDGGIGQGADQFITQDLTQFCASAASLYSSLGKPLVDLFVFNYQLYRSLGPLALGALLSNYFLTATLLRRLSPPFGKLKAVEGRREGDFRGLHARLIANAEEVAFYGGEHMEKVFLDRGFKELKGWMEGIYSLKIRYNMLEDFVLKYSWSAFGYLVTSLPVFLPAWGGLQAAVGAETKGTTNSRMKDFITNKRLMLSLADAGGRMMYSLKDLAELAGYTSRVYTLISTLHRVHASAYFQLPSDGPQPELFSLADVQGTIHKGFDGVRLEGVPIVAPALFPMGGDELLSNLNLIIHSGDHLLITGPNGVGKSAIARVVAGLWPVYRGLVSRPRPTGTDGIMFLPQRPYLSTGTLRDQVIYPHTEIDMRQAGRGEADLMRVLEAARLAYLPDREGGWDTRKEWKDVLSGGEKQRMGIARLLYHEPRYAFVDEGTSAVSSDVEGLLYEQTKAKGITLITISTRASLKRYHTYTLTLGIATAPSTPTSADTRDYSPAEGQYTYAIQRIGTAQEKQSVEKELAELRAKLGKVEQWRTRRDEIDQELHQVLVDAEHADAGNSALPPPSYLESEVHARRQKLDQQTSAMTDGSSSLVDVAAEEAEEAAYEAKIEADAKAEAMGRMTETESAADLKATAENADDVKQAEEVMVEEQSGAEAAAAKVGEGVADRGAEA
ncbi:hypothetical protein MRB53_039825 [Persea americana]|nr:hypothetical protein MRB53_039825 [Persea americana]